MFNVKLIILAVCVLLSGCSALVTNGGLIPQVDMEKMTSETLQKFTRRNSNGQNEDYVVLRKTSSGITQLKFEDRGYVMTLNTNKAQIEKVTILSDDSAIILLRSDSSSTSCGYIRTVILVTKDDIQVMDDEGCNRMESGEVGMKNGSWVYRSIYPQKNISVWVVENGTLYSTIDDRPSPNNPVASSGRDHEGKSSPIRNQPTSRNRLQLATFVIPKKVPEAEVASTKIVVSIK